MTPGPLIVIPVRGGSVGIPRKGVRLLGGLPVLTRTLRTVRDLGTVVVVTDDDEVELIAHRSGVLVLREPHQIAGQFTGQGPIDPVIWWAVTSFPERYDPIVSVQATCPFLERATLREAIDRVQRDVLTDTVIAVRDDRGLRWTGPLNHAHQAERSIRQHLSPIWRETGAFVVTRRKFVLPIGRFGPARLLVELAGAEGLDLDTIDDWALAEAHLARKRIAYRVDGGGPLGMGHVYRGLALKEALVGHDVWFVMDVEQHPDGATLARSRGVEVRSVRDALPVPDVLVVDGYPTTGQQFTVLRRDHGTRVVTIEDWGIGAMLADATINDLASPEEHGPQRFQGPSYAVLRDEFCGVTPKPLKPVVEHVVLTFGATDPTQATAEALRGASGFRGKLTVLDGTTKYISPVLLDCDLAISSCGRTIYELAACGVPTLSLPVNQHEIRHIPNALRVGARIIDRQTLATWPTLAADASWRMRARGAQELLTLQNGTQRVVDIILGRGR